MMAELTVAVAVGVKLQIFLPEQLLGESRLFQQATVFREQSHKLIILSAFLQLAFFEQFNELFVC